MLIASDEPSKLSVCVSITVSFKFSIWNPRSIASRNISRNWADLEQRLTPILFEENLRPAPLDSMLQRNIFYVLQRLNECGNEVVDVLLYWTSTDALAPATAGNFRLVKYQCLNERGSNFIRLPS
jgi:hypothetical protein